MQSTLELAIKDIIKAKHNITKNLDESIQQANQLHVQMKQHIRFITGWTD